MADDNKAAADAKKAAEDKKASDEKYLASQQKTVEARVAQAYEHEDPTPTQAENDAAKLAALGQTPEEPPPEGAVLNPPPAGGQRRAVEANQPGGYQTRSTETRTDKKE